MAADSARGWRDALVAIAWKSMVSAGAWRSGFRAVSDDDFARVTLAQEWARAPKLDPTGTSWLPFPFWTTGVAMRVSGDTSLAFARGVAFVLGLVSALLVLASARLLLRDRRAALVGTLVACAFPWSARLGIATVPELPTAALSLVAVAAMRASGGGARVLGGLALVAACLSRYEPWTLALVFAAAQLSPRRAPSPRLRALAALLALSGPAAWVLHNARVHGDPLHFLARVSAYKRAVAGEDPLAVIAYPLALIREEPELWLAALGALLVVPAQSRLAFRAPVVAVTSTVLALSLAAARGGAPTHHNGRAILVVWLLLAVHVGAAAYEALEGSRRIRRAFAAVVFAALPLGAFVLRPWYARLDAMADRESDAAIGRRAASLAGAAPMLLEVRDFGYFAVLSGSGHPERFVLDRTIDPRDPASGSSFRDEASLRARLASSGARHVVATEGPATGWLGAPLFGEGAWRVWRVPGSASARGAGLR